MANMTETYEIWTESYEYQYPTFDALIDDLNRFESDAMILVYAYSGGPYDEASTSAHRYHVGKGAWQRLVYSGTIAKLSSERQFEQDYMALATAALGGR
jgi:hypothetical protein